MTEHLLLEVISGLTIWIPRDALGYLIIVYFTIYFTDMINKRHKK